MADITENIEDIDMDDCDGNRAKKIREYSFSPTKTPSKRGRDELRFKNYYRRSKNNKQNAEFTTPYSKSWNQQAYYSIKDHIYQKHRKVEDGKHYDIDKFRMIDQPNYDGVDEKIIIWCSCDSDGKPYFCSVVRKWTEIITHKFNYFKWKTSYENLLRGKEQSKQVSRDIERTFKKYYAFRYPSLVHRLSRVLNAISLYDDKLGYVQGMNFVVGSFLIHCEENIAFWLFVELLESYELREVYDDGLKGMYRHSGILAIFMKKYMPDLLEHLESVDITIEMFMSDWVISFLCSFIPLNRLHTYLTGFFVRGWVAFHCMVLAILTYMKDDIMKTNDMPTCINMIKTMKEFRNSFKVHRTEKSARKRDERLANGEGSNEGTPKLKVDHKNSLSLDFRRKMGVQNQDTSDEEWDEIYAIFFKFIKKIKDKDYNEAYSQVQI